jgi:uncharacterized membrane-anchored protein
MSMQFVDLRVALGAPVLAGMLAVASLAPPALAQNAEAPSAEEIAAAEAEYQRQLNALAWVDGPQRVDTVGNSSLDLPAEYTFLPWKEAETFMHLMENPTYGDEFQVFAPANLHWFAVVGFSADGYVPDDETIDKDAILKSISEGTEEENAERIKNGWSEVHVVGWRREPSYDPETNHLEWAIDFTEPSGAVWSNFQTRILGRRGVASIILVTDPQNLDADVADFKKTLAGFTFNSGDTYAEFKEGDKIAEYGLAALIAGGAAAAAAKTGILKTVLKFAWVLIIPVIAFGKTIFGKIFGRSRNIGQ